MSDDNDPDDVRPDDASVDIDEDRSQATTDPSIQDVRSDSRHPRLARSASVIVMALAGLMMTTAATNSRGHDLRPERDTDMATLGLEAVSGKALRVTLDDAPLSENPDGVDANMLVVHQQDIQMVVNTLWSGGAEAMTIQGQRVISTTAVKCVGNTVVLHGVAYAPPYVIEAIGDLNAMQKALDTSEAVRIYKEYVSAYQLGWSVERAGQVTMPAYTGAVAVSHATPR